MSVTFQCDTRQFQAAAAEYARRKNKSDADVVNKAMRYLLPFAGARVRARTPGPIHIRTELTGQARRISRGRSKAQSQLANTVAAALVAARMRKRGPVVLPRRALADKIDLARISDFYDRVGRFVNSRVRSANYLRAGFIPAYRQFNVGGGRVVGHNRFKGRSRGVKAVPSLTKTVEAYALNAREGAAKIAPNAFRDALPEVTRMFVKWLEDDTRQQAVRSGFY